MILDPVSRKVTSIRASPTAIYSDFHNPERHSQYLQQTPTSILYTFLLSSTSGYSGLLLTTRGFTGILASPNSTLNIEQMLVKDFRH